MNSYCQLGIQLMAWNIIKKMRKIMRTNKLQPLRQFFMKKSRNAGHRSNASTNKKITLPISPIYFILLSRLPISSSYLCNFYLLLVICQILNLIQKMGNICPCPKRNQKKQFTYDVHQQTFEMQDNIQNIGQHSPKTYLQGHQNILTDDIRISDDGVKNLLLKDIKQDPQKIQMALNTVQQRQKYDILSSSNNSSNKIQEVKSQIYQKSSQAIVELIPIVQQKPKFQANILKPKIAKKIFNPDDYRFINQNQSFRIKKIDSIKEQQYDIRDCKHCQFFIFDITANLYIDDCEDCFIFLAPCESTVFVRNCKRITLVAATKQFRTYECHQCVFSLYCKSQPVIQSSSNLRFTSFKCPVYQFLPKQFSKKRFEPWNNHWSQIHNFTKKEGEKHFQLHKQINLQINWQKAFQEAELQFTNIQNPIPFINGDLPYQPTSEAIIIVNPQITNQSAIQALKDTIILRSFQGVVAGQGKTQKRAILIDPLDITTQKFQQIGKIYIDPTEIAINKAKWFISFNDERQK